MNNTKIDQIQTEFQKRFNNDAELREKLEKAVNQFRQPWKGQVPTTVEKTRDAARSAFFKIAELVTLTYATKAEWDEKETLFIRSYSRESTANPRPMDETTVIEEIRQNVQIGYSAIITNAAEAAREFNDLYGFIKRYYSQFWK